MKKEISHLLVLDKMVKDNNQGIHMSGTLAVAATVSQGTIVGFGVVNEIGKDAQAQTLGLPGEYMFMCFAVKRSEFEKVKSEMQTE